MKWYEKPSFALVVSGAVVGMWVLITAMLHLAISQGLVAQQILRDETLAAFDRIAMEVKASNGQALFDLRSMRSGASAVAKSPEGLESKDR